MELEKIGKTRKRVVISNAKEKDWKNQVLEFKNGSNLAKVKEHIPKERKAAFDADVALIKDKQNI